MTWLAPVWFALAAVAAAGAVALHLIAAARARPSMLPTARFVPAGTATASARAARPTDVPLLAVRVATLLLLGAAFARPVVHVRDARLRRVIVADVSRGAQMDLRDSVRVSWRDGDALVVLDSAAREVARAGEAIDALTPSGARGALSAGIAAARQAARRLARSADSVELVLVTPLTIDELDSATVPLARAWPGRVRVVRTRSGPVAWPAITMGAAMRADDPLAATVALLGAHAPPVTVAVPVRVVRGAPTAADSNAARDGAAMVTWPRFIAGPTMARGVTDGRATVVAPLGMAAIPAAGTVLARWADGAAAAVETASGRGCVRTVGIGVPEGGDVALQPEFVALARTLLGPCVARAAWPAASGDAVRAIVRAGAAASATALRSADEPAPLTPWLLAAALALLVAELWLRRRPELAA